MESERGNTAEPLPTFASGEAVSSYPYPPPAFSTDAYATASMNADFWRDRRVFVTGHTGFKGAWLCLWLNRLGAKVTGYALAPPTSPSLYELAGVDELVDSAVCDVRDLPRLKSAVAGCVPDVLIHMAAQSVVLDSYKDPVETYSTNVMGSVNLFEAARGLQQRISIVNVTTDKVYLNQASTRGCRETDALGGSDPYSSSKACSELVTQAYRRSFFPIERVAEHGVAVASARAGNVIGGGDWTPHQLIPDAVAAFARGAPVALRHPDGIRPWQHVLDCLHGYLRLAEALTTEPEQFSGEWNFGPAVQNAYTVAQVADALAGHWKVTPAWTSAAPTPTREELELRLDSSKANRLLNWRCTLPIHTALDWVAKWYLQVHSDRPARQVCEEQIEAYMNMAALESAAAERA